MKVVCTQENLKTGLLTVGRIISTSSSLPILSNVLIKTENGLLKISSTNLEIGITTQTRCKIEEEGEITVLCKTITDLVANLPNKNIILTSSAGGVDIETENYHSSIKTLPAEDFPLIPKIENGAGFSIDAQELKKALEQVVFAAATNQTQPEITGVFLSVDSENLKIVATDRYRLAEKKIPMEKKTATNQEVIVPQKTLVELGRIIGVQKGQVEAILNESQISLQFNDTHIISRLVDGQYPDYKQIIPTSFNTTVIAERLALIGALKTGGIFSQNNNSVKFSYNSDQQKLVLTAESQDLGKSVVEVGSQIEGPGGELVLNYHYLLDCLASTETERVIIKIVNDSSPSLILPEGKDDYMYLVMPIKT